MEILRPILLVALIIFISSCRKDELSESLYNPFEEIVDEEILVLDTLIPNLPGASSKKVEGFFHIRYELFKDTSIIKNVNVYSSYEFGDRVYKLNQNQRSYFIDINVSANRTFKYRLSITDDLGKETKLTKEYSIYVP